VCELALCEWCVCVCVNGDSCVCLLGVDECGGPVVSENDRGDVNY
jgi:hypothetical protein